MFLIITGFTIVLFLVYNYRQVQIHRILARAKQGIETCVKVLITWRVAVAIPPCDIRKTTKNI